MPHPIEIVRELFQLAPDEEESILSLMEELNFKRGDRIEARSFMRGYGLYVVKGMVRVFYVSNGREHTFSFALDGEYVSPSHLLLGDPNSVMCVEFLEPTDVISLSHQLLDENIDAILPRRAREVTRFIAATMMEHMKYLEERVILLQTANASQRYHWMEQRYPRVLERATIVQVASFLGITKETIYRIRSNKYTAK